jgi:hypothetical protein
MRAWGLVSAAFLIVACAGRSPTDLAALPAQDRSSPVPVGTRAQVQAAGASCSSNSSGPSFCTTTNPDCELSFDAHGELTHLRCTVAGLVFDCTRPCGGDFACTWSDAPGCADVYASDGTFAGYFCSDALSRKLACPGLVMCANRDEMSCQPPCRADYCPDCAGGKRFTACNDGTAPPPPCPKILCPAPCAGLDEKSCIASGTCHPVYRDDQNCGCAPLGCCAHYDHCGTGAQADCSSTGVICDRVPPHCEGDYVIAYASGCYEGCVHTSECAGSTATCGPNGEFPSFDTSCMGSADCAIGTRQTDCCGTRSATGISRAGKDKFDQAAAACDKLFPACACPTRGILCEDGQYTVDPNQIAVGCTSVGECRTYVQ